MSTKMLINAQRPGHLRVAVVKDTQLEDYQVETAETGLCRGNIYRGVVANIQPSLNAAFVDIGEDRHGFLPMGDTLASAWHKKPPEGERRPKIEQVLERGKPIYVQVAKDGVGQKGAALTTNLAIAGRYLVLTPFDEVRGISRKADDDASRKKARERLAKLDLPDKIGVIVRTNGIDQNQTLLNRDLNALLRLWKRIREEGSKKGRGPRLLYSDQDLVVQSLRDYLDSSIEQLIVDNDELHEKCETFMRAFMPRSKTQLVHYQERQPLFSRFNLDAQIDGIYERRAPLPGGGSIVIDATEALTAIDVNSGRANQDEKHDDAILRVNLEAAAEVARQLRLRDIGGLVVVDFIDMRMRKHQRKLEKALRDALKSDRARCAVGNLSPNGLLEINRQKIKQALRHRTHRPCPTCQGVGSILNPDHAALNLLGRIEARASTGLMERAMVILHPEIADALQNGHRRELAELEAELQMKIEIISSPTLTHTQDRIEWTHRERPLAQRIVQKATAALSATDLAGPDSGRRRKDEAVEEASEDRPKKRRRRRRKSSASESESAERTEVAKGATSDDEQADARRRRPSRRRGPASDEPAAKEAAAGPAASSAGEKSSEDEQGEPRGRSSRRRRPSRRRPSREPARDDAEVAAEAPSGAAEAPPVEAEKAPTRRRRPVRRRGRAEPSPADAAEPSAAQGSASRRDAAEAPQKSTLEAPQDEGEPRRRRRRPASANGDAAAEAVASGAPAESEDRRSRTSRRRAPRRRGAAADRGPEDRSPEDRSPERRSAGERVASERSSGSNGNRTSAASAGKSAPEIHEEAPAVFRISEPDSGAPKRAKWNWWRRSAGGAEGSESTKD